jgi:carboxylesterase
MINYAKKFGISKKILERWRSEEIYLRGDSSSLIILIPGWSVVTRQLRPLAKKLNATGHTVKCLKLSGHGTRPEDLEGVKWQDWVKDIVNEIRKNKNEGNFSEIIIGGISMGGSVCLLASLQESVDGIILIGTPVHLKGHLLIKLSSRIMPMFRKYTKKVRPRNIFFDKNDSYQYFPTKNVKEVLEVIEKAVKHLKEVVAPVLILQTKNDFFVTKYSPLVIYKNVSAKTKEMCWIHTDSENHVPQEGMEVDKISRVIDGFIKKLPEN